MDNEEFWKKIDQARALLRQGAAGDALKVLDQLEKIRRYMPAEPEPIVVDATGTAPLELAIDPHADDIPEFHFNGDAELCIDDAGWDIDQEFVLDLGNSVSTLVIMGMNQIDIGNHVESLLKKGIEDGKIRRNG
jgi:hypothetical protein